MFFVKCAKINWPLNPGKLLIHYFCNQKVILQIQYAVKLLREFNENEIFTENCLA